MHQLTDSRSLGEEIWLTANAALSNWIARSIPFIALRQTFCPRIFLPSAQHIKDLYL